ncbi:hypothetical protein N9Y92_01280 [Chlamydiales bacterium]|nr:hypothetical protein [Chlamydiales bacterium]
MSAEEIVAGVSKIGENDLKEATKVVREELDPGKMDDFAKVLDKPSQEKAIESTAKQLEIEKQSPIDLAHRAYAKADSSSVLGKIEESTGRIKTRIEEIKAVVENGDVRIKHDYQTLLENKLTHIDDNLKIALEKAGVEYTPTKDIGATEGIPNALERFLGFLARSQTALEGVSGDLAKIRDKGHEGNVSPGDVLTVQMKMHFVQQEMELFTNLLNKGLESTKTLMNVQV